MIELTSTAFHDDPDPDGYDKYGFLPLISEVPDRGSREEEMGAEAEDGGDDAQSIVVDVPQGTELPDDDDDAFLSLTRSPESGMAPGEAEDLIEYMRPLTPDEEELAHDPMFRDLEWVDDPSHTDDVLRAGKGERGVDDYLRDGTYGDTMDEERAERSDTDDLSGRTRRRRRRHRRGGGHGLRGRSPGAPTDAAYAASHGGQIALSSAPPVIQDTFSVPATTLGPETRDLRRRELRPG